MTAPDPAADGGAAARVVRRGGARSGRELQAAAIALLATIAIGSVLMLIIGKSPGHIWWLMLSRTFGARYDLGEVLYRATGIALTGLAVALALDAGLFNIGAEAQLSAGVVVCALVGAALPATTPAPLAILICLLAAAAGGGAVGAAIGGLRVARGANEVVTSIMFNKLVGGVVLFLGNRLIFVGGTTRGPAIAPGAMLPGLGLGGSAVNAALLLAALLIGAVWWLRARSTWGVAWRAVGQSPEAARSTGISVGRVQVLVMTASGALAGLAAANFVMGHTGAFEQGLGAGVGLAGISAALLGRIHPAGVAIAALGLGLLSASGLTVGDEVPKELTELLQGVALLAVAVSVSWVRRAEARR